MPTHLPTPILLSIPYATMILPTVVLLARQLPGPLNDVTDAGKNIATTATDAGKTATDAGKTATEVGKGVVDQAQNGVNEFNKYKGFIESLEDLEKLWAQYHQWAIAAAIALVVILVFLWIYCCVHCIIDCKKCCCTSQEKVEKQHKHEAHVPRPKPKVCCNETFHWDRTYIARACGTINVQENEEWGFWGRKDNWFYDCGRGKYRLPSWCPDSFKTEEGRRAHQERFKERAKWLARGAEKHGKTAYTLAEAAARQGVKVGVKAGDRVRDRVIDETKRTVGAYNEKRGNRSQSRSQSDPEKSGE